MSDSFKLYKTRTKYIVKECKKSYSFLKKARIEFILSEYVSSLIERKIPMVTNSEYCILSDEHKITVGGSNSLFIESKDFANNLLNAKSNFDDTALFEFPFNDFYLNIPNGVIVNGIEIPSCMITMSTVVGHAKEFNKFLSSIGKPQQDITIISDSASDSEISKDSQVMNITYYDKSQGVYVNYSLNSSIWKKVLSLKNAKDYGKMFAENSFNLRGVNDIVMSDCIVQFALTKLLGSLSIYNSATEGKYFCEGLPESKSGRKVIIEGDRKAIKNSSFTLSSLTENKDSTDTENTYRKWHFRNLCHEKYYQKEHEKKPKGSRWIFVSASVNNKELTPFTIHEE
jgi:hypothetical protein